jgi:hypothetical protein
MNDAINNDFSYQQLYYKNNYGKTIINFKNAIYTIPIINKLEKDKGSRIIKYNLLNNNNDY